MAKGVSIFNGYDLSRIWFDWCFENQEKIKPNHTALYFFIVEHNNRMGWVTNFGLPTTMAKDAIGISSYNTYINTLNDLVEWGFIKMVQKSKNQYSSNIIALSKNDKALNKALDKALIKHSTKQSESIVQSIDSINKQINNKPLNQETINKETVDCEILDPYPFNEFWDMYDKKVNREKSENKYKKLTLEEKQKIFETLPDYVLSTPDKKFRKNPDTYLNNKSWKDEIIKKNSFTGGAKKSNLEVLSEAYFDTSLEDKYKAMGD